MNRFEIKRREGHTCDAFSYATGDGLARCTACGRRYPERLRDGVPVECCRKTFAWEPNANGGHSYVCRHAETCPVAGVRR